MLLGTFKTVFNSVFLVPTKTNTPHHMAKMEGCGVLKSGRGIERRGRDLRLTLSCTLPDTTNGLARFDSTSTQAQGGQSWLVRYW